MRAEINYDLAMEDDMSFVEGAYRLPGGEWQVIIASRHDGPTPQVLPQRWDSGVFGTFVRFPRSHRLNRDAVGRLLSEALGVTEWALV
jgi:hypothetical protein